MKKTKHLFKFDENKAPIDNLLAFLKWLNFNIETKHGYSCYHFNGNGIRGMFSDLYETHPNVDHKIAFDNSECFNKISQCPVVLDLPVTAKQFEFLEKQLEYWSGKDGLTHSNGFAFEHYVKEYPRWTLKK